MKILTLNTWMESGPWRERWEVIFEGLEILKPDVIGFQEVFNKAWAEEVRKKTGMPYLVFPVEPGGQMFLSRYPVEEAQGLTMKTQAASENYLRYALYARLDAGGRKLAVFNTHLSWQLHETEVRSRQVGELQEFIRAKAGGADLFVLGDFNAPPETREIRMMTEKGGFKDAFAELYPKEAGLSWDNRNPFTASHNLPDRRLDYIFFKTAGDLKLTEAELVLTKPNAAGVFASDHYGVMAHFEGIP